jgi:uncharacterized damage-inducible protein DinB
MVRIVFGSELGADPTDVEARTLGEALDEFGDLEDDELRVFVDGVDAQRLEGDLTPVGDEDTILVTRW